MNNTTFQYVDADIPITSVVLYVTGVIYGLAVPMGVCSNIVLAFAILKTKYLRTPMNISLVCLAFSDILFCLLGVPVRLALYYNPAGVKNLSIFCKYDVFVKSMCDYIQPCMLVATSFERYKAIAKPFESKGKMKRILIIITLTWFTCILSAAVSTILFQDGATLYPCNMNFKYEHLSMWHFREGLVTFPFGLLCLVLVGCFYHCMLKTLHKHGTRFQKRGKPFNNAVHPKSNVRSTKEGKLIPGTTTRHSNDLVHPTPSNAASNFALVIKNTDTSSRKEDSDLVFGTTGSHEGHAPMNHKLPKESTRVTLSSGIHAYTRGVSVRKTRDVVFLPSKGTLRFPSFAKQVVTMQRHQRKSLERWNSKLIIDNGHGANTKVGQLTEEYKIDPKKKHQSEYTKHEHSGKGKNTELENDKDSITSNAVSTNRMAVKRQTRDKSGRLKEHTKAEKFEDQNGMISIDTISSVIHVPPNQELDVEIATAACHEEYVIVHDKNERTMQRAKKMQDSVDNHKCDTNNDLDKSQSNINAQMVATSSNDIVSEILSTSKVYDGSAGINTDKIMPLESKTSNTSECSVSEPNATRALLSSNEPVNGRPNMSKTRRVPTHTSELCNHEAIVNKLPNESVVSSQKEADDIKSELEPLNDIVNIGDEKHGAVSIDESKTRTKSKLESKSQVDIVDFDGTVHKDVAVEGAVVGAVCVMNKSNKLEGRRNVEMRAAKRIAVMIGLFVLLWLPLPLAVIIVSNRRPVSSKDIETLLVASSISASTVAINPILNLLLNKQLRSAAMSVIKRTVNSLRRAVIC